MTTHFSSPEDRLAEHGLSLPTAASPVANYVPCVTVGPFLFVSGQLPMQNGVCQYTGRVGTDITLEEGQSAARLCILNILAQVKTAVNGDWSRITRCVKLGGFIQATPDISLPAVMNGASDAMVMALGEAGRHTRTTVGVANLPLGAAVEIDALFEISSE